MELTSKNLADLKDLGFDTDLSNSVLEQKYYEMLATEEEFLEWYASKESPNYEKPSFTIDNVIFAYDRDSKSLKSLFIKRKAHPFKDSLALTGGFVEPQENTDDTCMREVFEETGLKLTKDDIEQLYTHSTPNRDPRGWVISTSYLTFLPDLPEIVAGDDAKEVFWSDVYKDSDDNIHIIQPDNSETIISETDVRGVKIAYDHAEIIRIAFKRIENKLFYHPNILKILGSYFTMQEVGIVHSKFTGTSLENIDTSNLRKTTSHLLTENGERSVGVGRPSKTYQLNKFNNQ